MNRLDEQVLCTLWYGEGTDLDIHLKGKRLFKQNWKCTISQTVTTAPPCSSLGRLHKLGLVKRKKVERRKFGFWQLTDLGKTVTKEIRAVIPNANTEAPS